MKIVLFISRIVVALVFIFSGIVKCIDPTGTAIKIDDYFVAWSMEVPFAVSMVLSVVQSVVEFVVGAMLLVRSWHKYASWCALLFMVLYMPLTLYIAIANPVTDCGCFGDAVKMTNWQTFFKNLVLLPMTILLVCDAHNYKNKNVARDTVSALAFVVLGLYVCKSGITDEPQIDFRPYAVGVNIPKAMEIPEDAAQPEYSTTFILEKDGKQQEFDEVNYPYNDSTWHFVTSKTEVISEGYVPPIKDFALADRDDNVVTEDILHSAEPIVLAISPRLEDVSEEHFELLKTLQNAARDAGRQFYIITATVDKMSEFESRAEMGFDFLSADEIMLKTITRANPGIIVLNEGTIVAKYHPDHIEAADLFGNPAAAYLTYQRAAWENVLIGFCICVFILIILIINLLYKHKTK
ncbi:MAG: DoxX family membrane protein [Bacteroidales bacterium]|nr:DoxX family membrane protein [Bacteroidales bacterium]